MRTIALVLVASVAAACAALGDPEPARLDVEIWSASWCGPCGRMERESWRDPRVERWIAERAHVATRDLDAEADLARRLDVVAIPCVVARREGVELGRLVGYRGPEPLLAWLETMAAGGSDLDAARAAARSARGDPNSKMRLASALRAEGRHVEASCVLVELWAIPRGERGELEARIGDESRTVAEADVAARDILRARCAELEGRVDADDGALADWIELGCAAGLGDEVAGWFVALEDRAARREPLVAVREQLWSALRSAGEYGAIVELVEISVPVRTFAANLAKVTDFERATFDAATLAMMRAERRARIEDLRRGLVELGREVDAADLAPGG